LVKLKPGDETIHCRNPLSPICSKTLTIIVINVYCFDFSQYIGIIAKNKNTL
jgi:hypothetical protein